MFGMKKYPSDELIDGFKEGGTGFTPFSSFQFAYQWQEEKSLICNVKSSKVVDARRRNDSDKLETVQNQTS